MKKAQIIEENSRLKQELFLTKKVFRTKLEAIVAFGEIMDRVTESENEGSKRWLAERLLAIYPLFDALDTIEAETQELKVVVDYLGEQVDALRGALADKEKIIDILMEDF